MASTTFTTDALINSSCLWDALGNQIRFVQTRSRAVLADQNGDRRLAALADVLAQVGRLGVLGLCETRSSEWSVTQTEIRHGDDAVLAQVEVLAKQLRERPAVIQRIADAAQVPWRAIALRVRSSAGSPSGLVVTFRESSMPDEWLLTLMEVVAMELATSRPEKPPQQSERELACAAAVLELASRMEASESLAEACQQFVEVVASHLSATIAIGLAKTTHSNCELKAISGVAGVDVQTSRSQALTAALDEILVHGEPTCWPPTDPLARHSLLTHRRLLDEGLCQSVLGMPIRDQHGKLLGAWVCLGAHDLAGNTEARAFLRACEFRLGSVLQLLQRAERSRWRRALDRLRPRVGGSIKRAVAISLLVLGGILAAPWPHRLKCASELQPVTRRFIAAPFDGSLQKAFVEPGDVVKAGDLLARIDDREINWELAGVDAEQQRAFKERDSKLAKNEIAASQLAHFEADRLEVKRQLLNDRGEHLEIRSPIAGIVIAGDLKRSEGVPLTVGKNLFEIAPLDRMIVEVAIPERDVAHASVGQKVDLTLEGFPSQHWEGKLLRIHPRSEMRESESVFIGEFELENANGKLLPGMHGQARLEGTLRPIGWLIFHRPLESLVFWMGW